MPVEETARRANNSRSASQTAVSCSSSSLDAKWSYWVALAICAISLRDAHIRSDEGTIDLSGLT
jgi:hypothetical protein